MVAESGSTDGGSQNPGGIIKSERRHRGQSCYTPLAPTYPFISAAIPYDFFFFFFLIAIPYDFFFFFFLMTMKSRLSFVFGDIDRI